MRGSGGWQPGQASLKRRAAAGSGARRGEAPHYAAGDRRRRSAARGSCAAPVLPVCRRVLPLRPGSQHAAGPAPAALRAFACEHARRRWRAHGRRAGAAALAAAGQPLLHSHLHIRQLDLQQISGTADGVMGGRPPPAGPPPLAGSRHGQAALPLRRRAQRAAACDKAPPCLRLSRAGSARRHDATLLRPGADGGGLQAPVLRGAVGQQALQARGGWGAEKRGGTHVHRHGSSGRRKRQTRRWTSPAAPRVALAAGAPRVRGTSGCLAALRWRRRPPDPARRAAHLVRRHVPRKHVLRLLGQHKRLHLCLQGQHCMQGTAAGRSAACTPASARLVGRLPKSRTHAACPARMRA
jgi:hypothetical protein